MPLTVKELIDWLGRMPPDLPVAYPTESGYVLADVVEEREVFVYPQGQHVTVVLLD